MVGRRSILKSAVVLAAGRLICPELAFGAAPSQPFDYAWLKGQARKLAGNAFQPSPDVLPPAMAKLSYDQFQSLRFRTDHALWSNAGLAFRRWLFLFLTLSAAAAAKALQWVCDASFGS